LTVDAGQAQASCVALYPEGAGPRPPRRPSRVLLARTGFLGRHRHASLSDDPDASLVPIPGKAVRRVNFYPRRYRRPAQWNAVQHDGEDCRGNRTTYCDAVSSDRPPLLPRSSTHASATRRRTPPHDSGATRMDPASAVSLSQPAGLERELEELLTAAKVMTDRRCVPQGSTPLPPPWLRRPGPN
jgi:hypothetical protein